MSTSIEMILFAAASGMEDEEERRAFLAYTCGSNPKMRELLEGMLKVRDESENFFTIPTPEAPEGHLTTDGQNESNGTRLGRYRLLERLGAGGCGVVYLAEQLEPVRRKVALKIIRLGMDTESVIARFAQERQALAMLNHPCIARVLDAGAATGGRPYFVMELSEGEKITDFCEHNKLSQRQRLELFILICEAIQHAHQKGVIHRDIKPSNILVRESEGRILPKVIDFGIAKISSGGLDATSTATSLDQLIGTPAYMSPEQAERGMDIDTRSDIYSLGALLYELLAGTPPLQFEELSERGEEAIRGLLLDGRTVPPSTRLKEMSQDKKSHLTNHLAKENSRFPTAIAADLDWIVMKAIEKDRQRRYETANGLAMDVRRFLKGEPVAARPPSRWYLLTKLAKRNRVLFIASGIALFGLLGGFGISTWLFFRERSARHEQARLRVLAEVATTREIRLREYANTADRIAQAAVLLKYDQIEEADKLIEKLSPELVPSSLEASRVLQTLSNWNLEQGQRQAAARRFYLLGHVLTSVDMSDSERISITFLSVATAIRMWGEPEQFDKLRTLAIQRFGDSANPVVAEQIVKATLLDPASPETLKKLAPLREVLLSSIESPSSDREAHMIAWRTFSLSLLAYREGRLEAAADLANESLSLASNSKHRTASNHALLAMIGMRSGDGKNYAETLASLREEVDQWLEGPFYIMNPDATYWYNQYATHILLLEAESLLPQGETSGS